MHLPYTSYRIPFFDGLHASAQATLSLSPFRHSEQSEESSILLPPHGFFAYAQNDGVGAQFIARIFCSIRALS
jgi:hypothetical protein